MKKALVVDDSRVVRSVSNRIMQGLGFEVREAENGEVALNACKQQMPDVILLDLMLPMMDGWAFRFEAERQQALGEIPIIVTSGSADVRREPHRWSRPPISGSRRWSALR